MPLVSVIVPVYNAVNTLANCAKSVLEQSVEDLELLLIDDGSTDASGALCDAFAAADPRVHVVHKENGGVSTARNAGLACAHGQWIVFLDSDDHLSPYALEIVLKLQNEHSDKLILWKPAYSEDEFVQTSQVDFSLLELNRLARLQIDNCLPMPWNKLYNTDRIRRNNLSFDPGYTLGEDLLFCMAYISAFQKEGGTGYLLLQKGLTFYNQLCPDSLTRRLHPEFYDLWKALYSQLLALCENEFNCPADEIALLRQSIFGTLAAGSCDLLARGKESAHKRRKVIRAVLRADWLRSQRRQMSKAGVFSLYEPAVLLAWPWLLQRTFNLYTKNYSRFLNLQYTGTAIRKKLHP